jgi:hypothetical protein
MTVGWLHYNVVQEKVLEDDLGILVASETQIMSREVTWNKKCQEMDGC